jgi:hypothetical protein
MLDETAQLTLVKTNRDLENFADLPGFFRRLSSKDSSPNIKEIAMHSGALDCCPRSTLLFSGLVDGHWPLTLKLLPLDHSVALSHLFPGEGIAPVSMVNRFTRRRS